jgi:hypothetical protein
MANTSENRNAKRILMAKPTDMRSLCNPRPRARIILKESQRKRVDWIVFGLGQGRLAGCCKYGKESLGSTK